MTPKIVFLDLETMPDLLEALKVFNQLSNWRGLTLRATINSILCGGYKTLGAKRTTVVKCWDFKTWDKDVNDDSEVCAKLYEALVDADAVVMHNGKKFDWPFLNTRFLKHGLKPLTAIPLIDTREIAKRNLFAFSNRLGELGKYLVGDDKVDNGGWQLWVDCYHKKKKALDLMVKYNRQDVDLLEDIYRELLPFIKNVPNYNLHNPTYAGGKIVCPSCGSTLTKKHGYHYTKTAVYQRHLCRNCGSTFRTDKKNRAPRSV